MAGVVQEEQTVKAWEEYITEGMEARASKDNAQWRLGDLATSMSVDYGEDTIGKYAYAVGVEKKTLMNYRTIAGRYGKKLRKKYQKLSFSHFSALSAVEKPEAWLEKSDNDEWSVETLRRELRHAYPNDDGPNIDDEPPEVYRCPECRLWRLKDISAFEICRGHYLIRSGKIVAK